MSRIPSISPITDDIEDIRHSEDEDFFGEDRGLDDDESREGTDEGAEDEADDLDARASASIEGGRGAAEPESWLHSA